MICKTIFYVMVCDHFLQYYVLPFRTSPAKHQMLKVESNHFSFVNEFNSFLCLVNRPSLSDIPRLLHYLFVNRKATKHNGENTASKSLLHTPNNIYEPQSRFA